MSVKSRSQENIWMVYSGYRWDFWSQKSYKMHSRCIWDGLEDGEGVLIHMLKRRIINFVNAFSTYCQSVYSMAFVLRLLWHIYALTLFGYLFFVVVWKECFRIFAGSICWAFVCLGKLIWYNLCFIDYIRIYWQILKIFSVYVLT